MIHGLPQKTVAELHRVLARRPEVEKAVLYGLRAKGTHQPGSDIDLALVGDQVNDRAISEIADELEDSSLPYRVDLCDLARIRNGALLDHIDA